MDIVLIDGLEATIKDVVLVARYGAEARLDETAAERILAAREVVDRCVENSLVRYGITTGFGKFCDVVINEDSNALLQKNLIMSHAVGVGQPLPLEVVRGMMFLRANALAVGHSGARLETIQALIDMLNADIVPVIPEKGSLGASGDLAPLSHMAIALCGMGDVFFRGCRLPAAEALDSAGLQPVELAAKEGLSLINGTQCMTAIGCLAAFDAWKLARTADLAACLTIQALHGITDAFDARLHEVRRQPGQIDCAANLRALLDGSLSTTRQGEERVQDAYALRCVPQIHGASRDAIDYVYGAVSREVNAVTDNPLIFDNPDDPSGGDIISGGNFHGQPVALAMDFLGIAAAELASVSERRIERLVNPALSNGLPAFLVRDGGLNSGFMIVQYTAAALVSENKVLAHPASVDSIPSSANQEDHVSMGTIAARKAREIIDNARSVVALELLAACQAIDLLGEADSLSPATLAAYRVLRSAVTMVDKDRLMYQDIEAARSLVADGAILRAAEDVLNRDEQ
ncbi:MAG: histidine ammonia-lyase [Spirochaetes bacterium GWD1_61_31]|nr:MAG: histidine ammonia-lyase [Spirochaetes bacterium GWB1_60_80]OHD28791.1 MAG: histidine ammonia-lyase [Spirochaetes bacterium GWC1_61_12]OHD43196.1 MAG: histidine ammonia-lyase [Spirochaetes bacterium GWE1_60_18]OHD44172.1 MAG: histidine ammonia-lyase [Spirochaetes bacterium GWD1_61_31]OHD58760.1 MAG: histidine ammonia-lyase [Spirochaetes bacterium GWF1_60_12]HAP42669.1 histidine ammonia-lyase [Spirochaetaceae bacterium]